MQRNRYHHISRDHGVELFEAAFSTQTFARHAHEGFAIGAIAEGEARRVAFVVER
ncbi:AraC family ligand binding domain-containing protein [Agrobacterium leguminum]|uniref:AraC family ligand binding domain-containing protein n=1 Tax=Agrobacterium leguminum TaxID=2792015 RepID=UPI003CE50392